MAIRNVRTAYEFGLKYKGIELNVKGQYEIADKGTSAAPESPHRFHIKSVTIMDGSEEEIDEESLEEYILETRFKF